MTFSIDEVIDDRFPLDDEWVRAARSSLGQPADGTVALDVARGWARIGGEGGRLVDVLFVLTGDQLGLGRTEPIDLPAWLSLTSIAALDALEGLPYPLMAVEIEVEAGATMLVGWTDAFCDVVVDLLVRLRAEPDPDEPRPDRLPAELADPSVVAALDDASSIDSLSPSPWVESTVDRFQPVEPAIDPQPEPSVEMFEPAPPAPPVEDLDPEPTFRPPSFLSLGPTADDLDPEPPLAPPFPSPEPSADHLDPEPRLAPPFRFEPNLDEPEAVGLETAEPDLDDPDLDDPDLDEPRAVRFEPVIEPDLDEPQALEFDTAEPEIHEPFRFEPVIEPDLDEPQALEFDTAEPDLDAPKAGELDIDDPWLAGMELTEAHEERAEAFFGAAIDDEVPTLAEAPTQEPGPTQHVVPAAFANRALTWPEPFRGATFLGGHREHQRRRKNVTLALTPVGLAAVSSGFNAWKLHVPWDDVVEIEFESSDEVKFTHNEKIGSTSSTMIVSFADESVMIFEIRGKRPSTLRSSLAPILSAIRTNRANLGYAANGGQDEPFTF